MAIAQATFGMGCFWCTEAVFQQLAGVQSVVSGYTGGHKPNPTYREVCSGVTGHAEVSHITYDSSIISFEELLEVFWTTHDPTTLNRQGNDVGTMYRSAIYYHNEEQKAAAMESKQVLDRERVFKNRIVTEIAPADTFYPAENYHQNFYNENTGQGYCQFIIRPKVEKVRKVFKEKVVQK